MEFILAGHVLFKFGNTCYLQDINSPSLIIELNQTSAELLKILLLANGGEVRMHWIMYLVWERKGKSGTYNNVTTNVFNLRKAFDNIGLDRDAIINTPGKGYALKQAYTIIKKDEGEKLNIIKFRGYNDNKKRKLSVIVVSIVFMFMIFLAVYAFFKNGNNLGFAHKIGKIGACDVYTFDKLPLSHSQKLLNIIDSYDYPGKGRCSDNENVFIFLSGAFTLEKPDYAFIAKCVTTNDKIISCSNYIRSEHD